MNNKDCCRELPELIDPKLFKCLCDPNRIRLLNELCCGSGPSNVKEAAKCCDIDFSVVSRHLAMMKEAGVLRAEKRGKEVFYSVNARELAQTLRALASWIEERAQPQKEERR